jgi:hypothetical protein
MMRAQIHGDVRSLLRRLDPVSQWAIQRLLIKLATVAIFAGFIVKRPALESILMLASVNILTSVTLAIFYREPCNDGPLNHWDEAMAFTAICAMAHVLRTVVGIA